MADVMWARPDGERVLLAPDDAVAELVTAVYAFDRVEVVPFSIVARHRRLDVRAGPLQLRLVAGRGVVIPGPRPVWVTRWVEAPVARAVLGVETYGVSPLGVREWYRAGRWRPVTLAAASVGGSALGDLRPLRPPLGVGFSEPPARPAWVDVRPRLQDPSGRFDAVLAGIDGRRPAVRFRTMATATTSTTPNPDAMKYSLDVSVGEMVTISSAEAAATHPLASAIFAGGGVASVFANGDFLTVTREPGADWDTITARVQAAVGDHL